MRYIKKWNNIRGYALRIAVGIVVISFMVAGVNATPASGTWKGTTSQGEPIKFVVSDSYISDFNLSMVCPNYNVQLNTSDILPITNDQFLIDYYDFDAAGTFTSSTSASGTFSYYSNYYFGTCSISGTWTTMLETGNTCANDLNGDKTVGIGDVVVLVNHWGAKNTDLAWNQKKFADLNKDGTIGIGDVVVLVNNWGKTC